MSAFKIPQMLLVLAKEIFEWCLVAEDIIVLAHKIIYVLRKVGIGTILELSCAKWEFSLCCAIPEW